MLEIVFYFEYFIILFTYYYYIIYLLLIILFTYYYYLLLFYYYLLLLYYLLFMNIRSLVTSIDKIIISWLIMINKYSDNYNETLSLAWKFNKNA